MEKITEAKTVISRDSSVKIVTRLEPGRSGFRSWKGEIFSPHHCPDKICDLHILISSVYWGLPGTNHSSLSSDKVKNVRSPTSTLLYNKVPN
jgi:hypothetical protein